MMVISAAAVSGRCSLAAQFARRGTVPHIRTYLCLEICLSFALVDWPNRSTAMSNAAFPHHERYHVPPAAIVS